MWGCSPCVSCDDVYDGVCSECENIDGCITCVCGDREYDGDCELRYCDISDAGDCTTRRTMASFYNTTARQTDKAIATMETTVQEIIGSTGATSTMTSTQVKIGTKTSQIDTTESDSVGDPDSSSDGVKYFSNKLFLVLFVCSIVICNIFSQ